MFYEDPTNLPVPINNYTTRNILSLPKIILVMITPILTIATPINYSYM